MILVLRGHPLEDGPWSGHVLSAGLARAIPADLADGVDNVAVKLLTAEPDSADATLHPLHG